MYYLSRLCVPHIMSLGLCFKKIAPRQRWRIWWYSAKIHI